MSQRSICLCSAIRRSSRAVTGHYDAALVTTGLTTPQFGLLRTLEREGPLSMTDFARTTGHDRTTLSRSLGPLKRDGLVACAGHADARRRTVELTEKGRVKIAKALPHWQAAQEKVADLLGKDQEALMTLLARVEELDP